LQKAYKDLGYQKGDFPVAEEAASHILSLPMFAGLSAAQQDRIAQKVLEFADAGSVSAAPDATRMVSLAVQGS
jgi:dTDP-4-amino-4,6-dideoxygalactose transaminase